MQKFAGVTVPEIVIVSGGEFVAVIVILPFKGFTDAVPTAGGIAARHAFAGHRPRIQRRTARTECDGLRGGADGDDERLTGRRRALRQQVRRVRGAGGKTKLGQQGRRAGDADVDVGDGIRAGQQEMIGAEQREARNHRLIFPTMTAAESPQGC